jgi:eukaryotic translation initiation factor 2C
MQDFAVSLPAVRWKNIETGVKMLNWQADPFLNNYGVKISPNRAEVRGRILPTPEPTFLNGKVDARTAFTGRWRIDGKKFLMPNTRELKAWGVGIIDYGQTGTFRGPSVPSNAAVQFFTQFMKIYTVHGGKIANPPVVMNVQLARGGEMITDLWNSTGNKFNQKPQLLFFLVMNSSSEIYEKIKKSCECRYGVVSQVLQSKHIVKCQDQYISNVCMKVNAKLGGSTCKAASQVMAKLDPTFAKTPTLIIGADVSHGAPGSVDGSMAALTASMTTDFTRYAALCQTNGNGIEIISTTTIMEQLKKLAVLWMSQPAMRGMAPQRVIYYRDGVSSGQYRHVLDQEVTDMKNLFKALNPKVQPKFTVIICAKRHHIRFFPAPGHGDRNGNPQPGTLVETGCTNPFEFDFYLSSHSAIKGTARPTHYHVLLDECKLGPQVLQQITFEHCFQYMRSTTPVSIVPAVYVSCNISSCDADFELIYSKYAHLASKRAKAHVNKPTISSGKKETHNKDKKNEQTLSSSEHLSALEIPPLIPLNNNQKIEVVKSSPSHCIDQC